MENLDTNNNNKNKNNKDYTHEAKEVEEKIEFAQKVFMTEKNILIC